MYDWFNIFVISGKGGVGKTKTAVNTARRYAEREDGVGLLDVDLTAPNIMTELPEPDEPMEPKNNRISPALVEDVEVISHESDLDPGVAMTRKAEFRHSLLMDYLTGTEWHNDTIFVDSPPGVVDEHFTTMEKLEKSVAVVVSTGARTSLNDAERAIDMLSSTGVIPLGVVLNMTEYVDEGEEYRGPLFNDAIDDDFDGIRGVPVITRIPFYVDGPDLELYDPIIDKILEFRENLDDLKGGGIDDV